MRPTASKRNIMIRVEASVNNDVVTLDQRKFKQILYNLLSNAVKFSHDSGVVQVVLGLDSKQQLELQVKDCGIGIKNEDLPRIFREFEQLDSGATRQFPGTGLGLALTKRIVELHEGTITVHSEFGKGSTFTIRIPSPFAEAKELQIQSNLLASREL